MAEIEAKKKHRKVLRTSFTKAGNRLYSLFKRSEPDFDAIETDWTCFELKYTELQVADNEIYSEMLVEATEENLLAEMEDCDGYKMRFTELHMLFKRLVNARNEVKVVDDSGNSVSSEEELKGKRRFKLPSIQFKRYDGNIKGWLPFWSQFKKIHDDSFIDKCDKIEYLIQATVEGSRARQLVTSFPMVADNYQKIIECMQARFGREDLQIEIYVRELLKLVLENSMATQKLELSLLYDSIETQLRALDTLGITSDKYAAILYPLIESCLPQDILRIWQRSSFCNTASSADRNLGSNLSLNSNMNKDTTLELKLVNLMSFLRSEVENEQKISLASDGFGLAQNFSNLNLKSDSEHVRKRNVKREPLFYTAAGLLNSTDVVKCLFCDGAHESTSCFKAQKMNLEEKKNCLSKHKACFFCLKGGHQARKCRTRLRCILCSKSHVPLMCPNLSTRKFPDLTDKQNVDNTPKDQTLSNFTHTHVFMQTVRVKLKGPNGTCVVRALIDSGSQRSYLLKSVASALGLEAKRREKIVHCLFGGTESNSTHFCYDVLASHGDYTYNMEVLDQSYICNEIPSAIYGPWTQELKSLNIELSDTEGSGPIELLLGLNVADIFYTGRRHILPSGLVAVETYFGWTIMGKSANTSPVSQANMTCLSLFVNPSITELWELDVLGIQEPSEKKSKEQLALAAKELFLQTVIINQEGRYEVGLPWLEGHPSLPANFNVAKRRLHSVVSKLKRDNLFSRYNEVFQEWENLKIIEKTNSDSTTGHFLPHRPVLKEGSTTAVRPVFDASAREKNKPSLNQCLEKGPNLIESIPLLLLKFRKFEIGVVSDIKKAFLQISVNKNDSEFLKFLWLNDNGEEIVLRHKRVVFGVNCSPFLLGATIDYHLSKCLENCSLPNAKYSKETIERLAKSFYVDNCICSMTNRESLNTFIREAVSAMSDAQFDLRGWEFSGNSDSDNFYVMVLGLKWFTKGDVLKINSDSLEPDLSIVTKRKLLSMAQKIFDPIGFTAPTTLIPKLLLQQLWEKQTPWDDPVSDEVSDRFKHWVAELPYLFNIEIPRWISFGTASEETSIHTFCDASQLAYAAVVFCRIKRGDKVSVHLLAAKSRVAPLRKLTIPRLELMGATIAARLYSQVEENFSGDCYEKYFWSDSSTVISWIQRQDEWGPFVWNRVREIRELSSTDQWHHLPGVLNPADLPSRGCDPKTLFESKWWEGPRWLYQPKENWPTQVLEVNEEEIAKEYKKKVVTTLVNENPVDFWHLSYFSKFTKTIRMIAYIFRLAYNLKHSDQKMKGELTVEELSKGEEFIFKIIQQESFKGLNDEKIKCLNPFYDKRGVIRLKSRIANREDTLDYRFPVVLPAKHSAVHALIMDKHRSLCHIGTQSLLAQLRENYWLLGGRRTVKSVIKKCSICKRFDSKPYVVQTPPLPEDRVRDAVPFEITGVDFAGPLYLKSGEKAWICLFTCAVYRAVHMELTLSLSTMAFLQVLRRFVARRGRPKILYSDNGTNFRGAENAFANIDWDLIARDSSTQRIKWKFNPPSASWWGGFFERLIGIVKNLLRRVLGHSSLHYEELLTLICDCEAVVNSRPITYISNDPNDLIAMSPAMFLRDLAGCEMPDCDLIDNTSLSRSARNTQRLREQLRARFRLEYLGQLKLRYHKGINLSVKMGDIVLVENDNAKRIEWPIGRVMELLPGKDGSTRLVRVKTSRGELLRPVQRLFLLEREGDSIDFPDVENLDDNQSQQFEVHQDETRSGVISKSRVPDAKITRSGRVTKKPARYL